jgi:hypothetical protein
MSAITSAAAVSPIAHQASTADPSTVAGAASMLMLKKSLDLQESSAVQLSESLPQPTLANMGAMGTKVNTYA